MFSQTGARVVAAAGLLLVALVNVPEGRAQANVTDQGRAIIQNMSDRVIASLSDENQTRQDRQRIYAELFRKHFDVPVIGRWVLGRIWQEASPQQRQTYLNVFEDYIVNTYAQQFASFTGERFRVAGAEEEGNGVVVLSEIVSPDDNEVTKVRFRMRPDDDGNLKIRDVIIENISMALTQRREFNSIYHRRGGTIDGLIEALREKIAQLERQDG